MHIRTLALAAIVATSLSAPAVAQQGSPLQNQFPGPTIPNWGYVPDMRKTSAAENPAVRTVAQNVYGQLVADNLNRSKLTQDVSAAFTDSTEKVLSQRLTELGTPAWTFVKNAQSSAGSVSIYRLKFATSAAYMTFGVADNGIVYALGLSKDEPLP
jgi:hypothetical protein